MSGRVDCCFVLWCAAMLTLLRVLSIELSRRGSLGLVCVSRWGDSPLRTVQIALFLNDATQVQEIHWISYVHDKVGAVSRGFVCSRVLYCDRAVHTGFCRGLSLISKHTMTPLVGTLPEALSETYTRVFLPMFWGQVWVRVGAVDQATLSPDQALTTKLHAAPGRHCGNLTLTQTLDPRPLTRPCTLPTVHVLQR